jgi:D-alanyl-D-alanine carboxypeptidase
MIDDFYLHNEYNDIPSDIYVKSGYRMIYEQGILYNSELEETGLKSSNKIAKPGSSEHHTGYALDLGIYGGEYTGKGVYKWINDSCYRYGFIIRYKDNKSDITGFQSEPWHFRYIGIPHAYAMEVNGLCFEEYIKLIKKFTPQRPFTINAEMGRQYQVYYVKAQDTEVDIPVPKNFEYSISGNNIDGFIVTVDGIFSQNGCDNINVSENEIVSSSDTENIPVTASETDILVSESEIQTGD